MGKFRLPTDPDSTHILRMFLGQSEFLQVGGGEVTLKGGKGGGLGVDKGGKLVFHRSGGTCSTLYTVYTVHTVLYHNTVVEYGVWSKYSTATRRKEAMGGNGTHHQLNTINRTMSLWMQCGMQPQPLTTTHYHHQ